MKVGLTTVATNVANTVAVVGVKTAVADVAATVAFTSAATTAAAAVVKVASQISIFGTVAPVDTDSRVRGNGDWKCFFHEGHFFRLLSKAPSDAL